MTSRRHWMTCLSLAALIGAAGAGCTLITDFSDPGSSNNANQNTNDNSNHNGNANQNQNGNSNLNNNNEGFCGDGQLDPGEDCDDGNPDPDDGCFNCQPWDRLVNTSMEGNQLYPAVALDRSTGEFVIVWSSDTPPDGSDNGILGQYFEATGETRGVEFHANFATGRVGGMAQVAHQGPDGFLVVWESRVGQAVEAWGRLYDPTPHADEPAFPISVATTADRKRPKATGMASHGFIVTYERTTGGATSSDVCAQHLLTDGTPSGGEIIIRSAAEGDNEEPAVDMIADGAFTVAWKCWNGPADADYGICGQRYAPSHVAAGARFTINTNTTGEQQMLDIALAGTGRFIAVWASPLAGPLERAVVGQRFDRFAATVGSEITYSDATNTFSNLWPAVAWHDDGRYVVVWEALAADWKANIFARIYASDDSVLVDTFRVNSEDADDHRQPDIAMNEDGRFVVVWSRYRPGEFQSNILARSFQLDEL